MKIVINNRELKLREKDVQIAQKSVERMIETIKKGAIENNMPTLYIAFLAVMKIKVNELLQCLDYEQFAMIVELLEGTD